MLSGPLGKASDALAARKQVIAAGSEGNKNKKEKEKGRKEGKGTGLKALGWPSPLVGPPYQVTNHTPCLIYFSLPPLVSLPPEMPPSSNAGALRWAEEDVGLRVVEQGEARRGGGSK